MSNFFLQLFRYIFFNFVIRPYILIVFGMNVSGIENLPKVNNKPAIIVANHNSHIDTLLLMSLFSGYQVLKIHPVAASDYFCDTKFKEFIFKTVLGVIPIDRHVKKVTKEDYFKNINDNLKAGNSIIIYPEGTRGDDGSLSEFKTGVAHIAKMNPDIPVVPCYINGPDRIAPKGTFIWIPFIADIYVSEPVYYDNTSAKEFTEKIKLAVQKLKDEHKKKEEL